MLPTLGLGFLVYTANARRLIFAALALSSLCLALSFRHHRRPWPLLAAAAGAGMLLYPFYHALEVSLWLGLVYGGLALLSGAAALDSWLSHQAGRFRVCPAGHHQVSPKE